MIVLYGYLALAVVMALLWARQRTTRNATSVDAAWALGLGFLALLYAWGGEGEPARRALVAVVACAWSFRLGLFLLRVRVMRESAEDGRYRAMREHWGARADFWFFFFYQGQALVAALFSLPFWFAMQRAGPLDLWDWTGAAVGLLAIMGELLADAQLAKFANQQSPEFELSARTGADVGRFVGRSVNHHVAEEPVQQSFAVDGSHVRSLQACGGSTSLDIVNSGRLNAPCLNGRLLEADASRGATAVSAVRRGF